MDRPTVVGLIGRVVHAMYYFGLWCAGIMCPLISVAQEPVASAVTSNNAFVFGRSRLEVNAPVYIGDRILVGRGGLLTLRFSSGSVATLKADSQIVIEEALTKLHAPAQIRVLSGEVLRSTVDDAAQAIPLVREQAKKQMVLATSHDSRQVRANRSSGAVDKWDSPRGSSSSSDRLHSSSDSSALSSRSSSRSDTRGDYSRRDVIEDDDDDDDEDRWMKHAKPTFVAHGTNSGGPTWQEMNRRAKKLFSRMGGNKAILVQKAAQGNPDALFVQGMFKVSGYLMSREVTDGLEDLQTARKRGQEDALRLGPAFPKQITEQVPHLSADASAGSLVEASPLQDLRRNALIKDTIRTGGATSVKESATISFDNTADLVGAPGFAAEVHAKSTAEVHQMVRQELLMDAQHISIENTREATATARENVQQQVRRAAAETTRRAAEEQVRRAAAETARRAAEEQARRAAAETARRAAGEQVRMLQEHRVLDRFELREFQLQRADDVGTFQDRRVVDQFQQLQK